jgi:hypothetical protein
MKMTSDGMAESGLPVQRAVDGDRTEVEIVVNQGGIDEMILVKHSTALASVHNGPTSDEASQWPSDVLRATALDLAAQLNSR